MARFHVIKDARTGTVTQVPFTQEEEEAFDALAAGPVPRVISDRQFFHQLAVMGIITKQEAKDAVRTGAIPAVMQAIIDGIEDEDEHFAAEMLLSGAVEFRRDHPLVNVFAQAMDMASSQVDDFFRSASTR
ncbi:MAG: hypothetical protein ACK4MV_16555 [Beijerinckiaceae bacterium]